MNSDSESISLRIEQIHGSLLALGTLLERERNAVEQRDLELLSEVAAQKATLCEGLSDALAGPSIEETIARLAPSERAKLEDDHKKLLTLARKTKDSNSVNGKVLARSQQSTRELLTILSGRTLEGLYGTSGRTDLSGEASTHEIARA